MTWQSRSDPETEEYALFPDWEKPGGVIDLELNELKQPFERQHTVFGPWPVDSELAWY